MRNGISRAIQVALFATAGAAGATPCALDPGFDHDGRARYVVPGFRVAAQSVARLPDGGYLISGGGEAATAQFDFAVFVMRLTHDGRLDSSYGSGGISTWTVPEEVGAASASSGAPSLAVAADGSAYVLIDLGLPGNAHAHRVLHFLPSGALDAGYGVAGVATPGCSQDFAGGLVVDASGRAFVSAGASTNATLARLTAQGAADAGFGTGGCRSYPVAGGIPKIAARAGGLELASGFGNSVSTLRIDLDGVPDPAYGGGDGAVTSVGPGGVTGLNGIAMLGDQLFGVSLTSIPSDFQVLRLDASGEFDATFGDGAGRRVVEITPGNDFSIAVAATSDRIAVTGVADATTPTPRIGFAWLDSHGQPAPECDSGQTYVSAVGAQAGSDGRGLVIDGNRVVVVGVASELGWLRDEVGVIAIDPGLLFKDGFED